MKPFLRQQLARYADRLGELEFLLSREDIMKDMKQFLVLSREHTEVATVATRWTRYQQREADMAAAQDLLSSAAVAKTTIAPIVDEHQPNYPTAGRPYELPAPPPGDEPDMEKYVAFVKRQVRELCTNYGEIHGFWWDAFELGIKDPSFKKDESQPAAAAKKPAEPKK